MAKAFKIRVPGIQQADMEISQEFTDDLRVWAKEWMVSRGVSAVDVTVEIVPWNGAGWYKPEPKD